MSDRNGSDYPSLTAQKHAFNQAICHVFITIYVDLQAQQASHGTTSITQQILPFITKGRQSSSSNSSSPVFEPSPSYQAIVDEQYYTAIRRIYQYISAYHQHSMTALRQLLEAHNQSPNQPHNVHHTVTHEAYERVLHKVFEKQITWGRIIMMFAFTGMLAVRRLTMENGNLVENESVRDFHITAYARWATIYLEKYLFRWIEANGGWEGLLTYEANNPGSHLLSEITGSLVIAGGVLLFGGLAAYLFAKGPH